MTVRNETPVKLYVLGQYISPRDTRRFAESDASSFEIHTDIGSCIIKSDCGNRSFINFGNIFAKESDKTDEDGKKVIIIDFELRSR